MVRNLQRHLGPDQLKIIVFEDFIDRFPASVREIEEFLEISHHEFKGIDPTMKVNPTESIPLSDDIRAALAAATRPQIKILDKLGVPIPEGYHI